MSLDLDKACDATYFLDHDAPDVREFVHRALPADAVSLTDKAVKLYYAVRDGVLYDIYGADLSRQGLRASSIARRGRGFCIHKSILYAAAVRSVGIPSGLVLTDVRNHLSSERLKRLVGGDVFHFHCLTTIYLNGGWIKVTPVFNKALCRLYGIAPLEFDGANDSLHHPYDEHGRRYMEFVRTHGEFLDFPYEMVIAGLSGSSPRLFRGAATVMTGSLAAEALAS
ncbi:MAG: transglutaminase domain-containing protein [Pseudonocardiales bacterium]|nr:transglutaminase domain-containing protein [Pseudonocardiales bacterium]MBV9032110.1 transglutaminase domain-containing protein [Pseudonocardiales bacterium]